MKEFGVRQFVTLLLSVSLVVIGYLGLVGNLNVTVWLFAALLIGVSVSAFYLGRLSTKKDYNE